MKISDNNTPLPDGVWIVTFHTGEDVIFLVNDDKVEVLKSNYWIFEVGDIEINGGWNGVECTKISVKSYYEITSKS